ncbi:unnamed protein product [Spirodela intermedia]|uniref:Uncharacterized protein n=1 Tax=Spirodela intermedia TaxID=51605 RepID=A0A7I8JGZ3_SPIIN|nr:unnamed protein product [Spirodela intermedia]CAA6668813.1 unnamed protein product [Spirodela intermedia]
MGDLPKSSTQDSYQKKKKKKKKSPKP